LLDFGAQARCLSLCGLSALRFRCGALRLRCGAQGCFLVGIDRLVEGWQESVCGRIYQAQERTLGSLGSRSPALARP
jgi:hypothetical protein